MDDCILSQFPNYTWLGVATADGDGSRKYLPFRAVAHVATIVLSGRRQVRLIGPAIDTEWTETAGTVHFLPADGRRYTLVTKSDTTCRTHTLLIPRGHLIDDEIQPAAAAGGGLGRIVSHDDAGLRSCMARLAAFAASPGAPVAPVAANGGPLATPDEAARALVRRLLHINGDPTPRWHDEASVFDRTTLDRLVARIDGRLQDPPPADDLSVICGLSPHHFLRKFRGSTGSSLHRFVNRRRVQAAMAAMPDPAVPLAGMAIDLGFSSQSHFTRLFGKLTGMTPARCRKHFGTPAH